jgi:ubiquinone/menaquinone biosynthesis C-methylase UbiE
MRIITKIEELEAAYGKWYGDLAKCMLELVSLKDMSIVLEAGCGSGRLTVPLAVRVPRECKIIGYDLSSGPYEGSMEILRRAVARERLRGVVEIMEGDVRDMKNVDSESVDLIVSHDLFCDLDRTGLELALKEFYRILRNKGQMVHAELSPLAENRAQELLIEADRRYSLESVLPDGTYWFSPTAEDVAVLMHRMGFRNIRVQYFETDLRLGYEVALYQLKQWKIDSRFAEEHEKDLRDRGLEFPLEHVIACEKL